MAPADHDDHYGVVRRANEDFQMDERDIGDVMESRSFTNAMKGESVC